MVGSLYGSVHYIHFSISVYVSIGYSNSLHFIHYSHHHTFSNVDVFIRSYKRTDAVILDMPFNVAKPSLFPLLGKWLSYSNS